MRVVGSFCALVSSPAVRWKAPLAGAMLLLGAVGLTGCGTTRWTDTSRTATEQLVLSDAIDRAVEDIDFSLLAGQDVYLNTEFVDGVTDQGYVIGSLRQKLLASGCVLKTEKDDAKYVVEPRVGAVGTDRHDLLYGVPATNIGSVMTIPGVPSSIPEIPIIKRTDQVGVAKLTVFAYEAVTGAPVWQSGVSREMSTAKDFWVLGAGPFRKGTIYDGIDYDAQDLANPLSGFASDSNRATTSLSRAAVFRQIGGRTAVAAAEPPPTAEAGPTEPMHVASLPQDAVAPGGPFASPPAIDRPGTFPAGVYPTTGVPAAGYVYPSTDPMAPGATF